MNHLISNSKIVNAGKRLFLLSIRIEQMADATNDASKILNEFAEIIKEIKK